MEPPDRVAAVILAAGESRRFGSPKQLAQLNGRTLLQHVVDAAKRATLRPIIAVVPPDLTSADVDIICVPNAQPELGMSHSLQVGFAALPSDVDAALVLLGDQPTIQPAALHAILAARGARPIVATRAAGRLGAPVLVERSQFAVVGHAVGDIGLREILRARPEVVLPLDTDAPAPDVDTAADLAQLQANGR